MERFFTYWLVLSIFSAAAFCKTSNTPKLRIGFVAGFTGSENLKAKTALNAFRLVLSEVNQRGGISGRQIEVLPYDTASSSINLLTVIERIKKDGLVALTGALNSNDGIILSGLAEKNHIPLIALSASHPNSTYGKVFTVSLAEQDAEEAARIANYIHSNLKKQNVAVLVDSTNSSSLFQVSQFKKIFSKLGGKIAFQHDIQSGEQSFSGFLQELTLEKKQPDCILALTSPLEGGYILSKLTEGNFNLPVVGNSTWRTNELTTTIKSFSKLQLKIYVPMSKHLNNQSSDAALSHDAAQFIVSAITKAGTTEPRLLMQALRNNKINGLTGPLEIVNNHRSIKNIEIKEFKHEAS